MNNNAHRQDDGTDDTHGASPVALARLQSGCTLSGWMPQCLYVFIRLVPFFQLKKLTTYKDTVAVAVADLIRHLSRYLA